jgi:Tfp pilus assembly protein PilX
MPKRYSKHRGMALVMVLSVIGVCTVLGYAMLSSASLQSQMGANMTGVTLADNVAESGINVGMYYLTHQTEAPSGFLVGAGPWVLSNVTVDASGNKADITVSKARTTASNGVIPFTYDILSASKGTLARSLRARVKSESSYAVRYAISSNSTVLFRNGWTAVGTLAVESTTSVTIQNGGSVTGAIVAPTLTKSSGSPTAVHTGTFYAQTGAIVPSPAQLNAYVNGSNQYVIDGVTYTAVVLSNTQGSVTRGPTTSNPAGVYIINGDATFNSNVTINGTLIVKNGRLTLQGSGNTITRAMAGYPALLVDQDIDVNGTNRSLTVNGVVYTGTGIDRPTANTGSQITINGALLMYSVGFDSSFEGQIDVTYDSSLTDVPTLSSINGVFDTARVLEWKEIHP